MIFRGWTARLWLGLLLVAGLGITAPLAQRGGGGGGGRGGGGGFGGGGQSMAPPSRLAMLTASFKLTGEQTKQVKTLLDAAFKGAAPLRASLAAARAPIGVALQAGRDQDEIDLDVATYAAQATSMADAEMQALASIVRTLTPEQRADTGAMTTAVHLMRGAFIGKKWDTAPDLKFY